MLKPISAFTAKHFTVIDRLIIKLGNSTQPSLCILQEQLPLIFRITSIEKTERQDGTYDINATIFNEKAQLDVFWNYIRLDENLEIGQLVSIRWKGKLATLSGKIVISRLVSVETAKSNICLFETVPHEWCRNRAIVHRMSKLLALLSEEWRVVFNTIFWDKKVLYDLISSSIFISTMQNCERILKSEYKFFININQSVLVLLINASSRELVHEIIVKQIVESSIFHKNNLKYTCWTTLLKSLDY